MRCVRAARMAPAIAATSRPPTRRSTSSGSARWPRWRSHGGFDRGRLARQPLIVEPGAAPRPARCRPAVKRRVDRGRDRGVADAHLAERQKVDAAGDRLHAERHGGGASGLLERRPFGDVARGHIEREIEHLEAKLEGRADLVDGGAAAGEIRHHLLRDARREGRDALRHDAVVAGEHRDERALNLRRRAALPGGKPFCDGLEAPEAAGWFRQHGVARPHGRDRGLVGARHRGDERANIVERQGSGFLVHEGAFAVAAVVALNRLLGRLATFWQCGAMSASVPRPRFRVTLAQALRFYSRLAGSAPSR